MRKYTLHKAGFIHLLGKPNAGKSTLFNNLIKKSLAITTPKAQTTRQTLIGISNGNDYQAIYVDTPGYIKPSYLLQQAMMRDVTRSLPGSDISVWIVDSREDVEPDFFPAHWHKTAPPSFLLINKRDLLDVGQGRCKKGAWEAVIPPSMQVHLISAHCKDDVKKLSDIFIDMLPNHPPYYEKDALTDKPQQFILAEIIRKALFLHYTQEIPYSTQVEINSLSTQEHIIHIETTIYVERESQKRILIGKGGGALKEAGTAAREELENFLQSKVFLKQYVKVAPKWRSNPRLLEQWGYN